MTTVYLAHHMLLLALPAFVPAVVVVVVVAVIVYIARRDRRNPDPDEDPGIEDAPGGTTGEDGSP